MTLMIISIFLVTILLLFILIELKNLNSSFRIRLFSFSSAFLALNSSYLALRTASLASLSASVKIFLAGPFFFGSFFLI